MDKAGVFHRLPHLDDSRLAEIFAREVPRLLVGKGLLSPEWAERILSWRHTGFNVQSQVLPRTNLSGPAMDRRRTSGGCGPYQSPARVSQDMSPARDSELPASGTGALGLQSWDPTDVGPRSFSTQV